MKGKGSKYLSKTVIFSPHVAPRYEKEIMPTQQRPGCHRQGENMNWKIIDSLACPETGTAFAAVMSAKSLKLILWYRGDYFLRTGNTLTTAFSGVFIDGRRRNVEIMHASPYNTRLWSRLIKQTSCPGNTRTCHGFCPQEKKCLFTLCPYGLRKYSLPSLEQSSGGT